MGNYIVIKFRFITHVGGSMIAKAFNRVLDSSHILVRDCEDEQCLLGRLSVRKLSKSGHAVQASRDLLRPAKAWERLLGG
jgi:hypothetical protein